MANPQGPYPRIQDLRAYVVDRLETRPGETLVTTAPFDQLGVHSIKRLNDNVPGSALPWTRVVGAGTKLYSGQTAIAGRDSGYSGDPLALVPYRPDFSPQSLMYVGDSNKMSKLDVAGNVSQMGIAPPLDPPVTELGEPLFETVELFDANPGLWASAAPAGALSLVSRANTTISQIIYDIASAGWACIVPTAYPVGLGFHALIYADKGGGNQELLEVEQVCPGIAATSIAAIQYDAGTAGPCSIVLTASSNIVSGLMRNSVLVFNLGGGSEEYVRVLSATQGQGNQWSFRCSTTLTHVAAESVQGIASFRAYTTATHSPSETLAVNCFQVTCSPPAGPDYYPAVLGTFTDNIDLSTIGGRPTQPEDEFHISLGFDQPANVLEVNLIMDVDSINQDFNHNYYYYPITQSYLASSIAFGGIGTTSAQQTGIQQSVVKKYVTQLGGPNSPNTSSTAPYNPMVVTPANNLGTPVGLAGTGDLQFCEVIFTVSDLLAGRVGQDFTRTLANVDRLRITVTVTDNTVVQIASWTLTGAYGVQTLTPGVDVGATGGDVFYRYRGRSSTTGAKSNPSPATRYGLKPHRIGVNVYMAQHPDPQVDKLDVFRFGGDITTVWPYVGTVDNGATPSFFDVNDDTTVAQSGVTLDFDNFQPFPTVDITHKGTCNVVGTTVVWVSGDKFDTQWAEGSEINVDGLPYTLYRQPNSTTVLEIVENAEALTNVPFFLQEPTLLARPLPAMWGPFYGQFFAVGDLYQPGYVFRTKGNNPDSAPDAYQDEVTSPSEPLMNGCLYNGGAYLWSTNRMFSIVPTQNADGSIGFSYQQIGSKGLYARWAFCVGDAIYYIETGGVGIRATTGGGEGASLTDQDMSLIFPHDGQPGTAVNLGSVVFAPPDMNGMLRLSYEDRHLYFDYTTSPPVDPNQLFTFMPDFGLPFQLSGGQSYDSGQLVPGTYSITELPLPFWSSVGTPNPASIVVVSGQTTTVTFTNTSVGNPRTLVYNTLLGVWSVDKYAHPSIIHYEEEGETIHSVLIGSNDGNIYQLSGLTDAGVPIVPSLRMPYLADAFPSFSTCRDGYVGIQSGGTLSLVVNAEGIDNLVTMASTAATYQKQYNVLPALKAKAWEFGVEGTAPWTLYQRDCLLRLAPWGGDYAAVNPFANLRRLTT